MNIWRNWVKKKKTRVEGSDTLQWHYIAVNQTAWLGNTIKSSSPSPKTHTVQLFVLNFSVSLQNFVVNEIFDLLPGSIFKHPCILFKAFFAGIFSWHNAGFYKTSEIREDHPFLLCGPWVLDRQAWKRNTLLLQRRDHTIITFAIMLHLTLPA